MLDLDIPADLASLLLPKARFSNWARSFHCYPHAVFAPNSNHDIQRILSFVADRKSTIRCYGAGHSPSDLACSDGYMLSVHRLNKIISVDRQNKRVRVQAGIWLRDLHKHLDSIGLHLSVGGSIVDQSLAGVISTASHGTGNTFQTYSAYVTALQVITADGTITECSPSENIELFKASLCGLGLTGVISEVEIQCEDAFMFSDYRFLVSTDEYIDACLASPYEGGISGTAQHVRAWWYPQVDQVVISQLNRVRKGSHVDTTPYWKQSFWQSFKMWFAGVYSGFINNLMYAISAFIPSILAIHIPLLFHISQKPFLSTCTPCEYQALPPTHTEKSKQYHFLRTPISLPVYAKSHEAFVMDCGARQYTYEAAIPIEQLGSTLQELKNWIENNEVPIHCPVEIRTVEKDDIWLSPVNDGRRVYVGMVHYKPWGICSDPYKIIKPFQEILKRHGGRPHWAKDHNCDLAELKRLYGENIDKFLTVRNRVDPQGIFVNRYARKHLGL